MCDALCIFSRLRAGLPLEQSTSVLGGSTAAFCFRKSQLLFAMLLEAPHLLSERQ